MKRNTTFLFVFLLTIIKKGVRQVFHPLNLFVRRRHDIVKALESVLAPFSVAIPATVVKGPFPSSVLPSCVLIATEEREKKLSQESRDDFFHAFFVSLPV